MKLIVILVAVLSAAAARRENSLKVIDSLREINPIYREFQTYLVKVVADAKQNASNIIFDLHSNVLTIKEAKLHSAIKQESDVLNTIDTQNPGIDPSCLGYLKELVDKDILLSGFAFSTCIIKIDDKLNAEIATLYNELDHDPAFQNISIYDVFRGQNIFESPNVIVDRLRDKIDALQNLPVEIVAKFLALLNTFELRLKSVGAQYETCLTDNDELLEEALKMVKRQLVEICGGTAEPINAISEEAAVANSANGW